MGREEENAYSFSGRTFDGVELAGGFAVRTKVQSVKDAWKSGE